MGRTDLRTWLDHLQTSGLINPIHPQLNEEFVFRHALVQDAAYTSLLRQDRKRLHRAIAHVLERNESDRLDELSPVLGQHYAEAGEIDRAIDYLERAGRLAVRQYAIPEALMHFTHALELTSANAHFGNRFTLLIARGQAYEMLSDFNAAFSDYEAALYASQEAGDAAKQCNVLIRLGMLWAGRDYNQTERCFNQAHSLAITTGDKTLIAQTFNRIGNYHINRDQPVLAVEAHQHALALFEELHDESGLLETLDYLGMASGLGGDMTQSSHYYERSIALAEKFDDRPRLIVGLTISAMGSSTTFQSNALAPADLNPPSNLPATINRIRRAHAIAQSSHLRSEEAYSHATLAMAYCAHGDMENAQRYADLAIKLATALNHTQWLIFAHMSRGNAEYEMQNHAPSRSHLEMALAFAESVGSWHWRRVASGALALTLIAQEELDTAEVVLDRALPPGTPARMLGQRVSWCSRVELALAQGRYELALQYIELLLTDMPDSARGRPILRVHKLYGRVLAGLGRWNEAEEKYDIALRMAESHQARTELWRIHCARGRLYYQQGEAAKSADALAEAQRIAEEIAATISDHAQRQIMLEGVARQITPGSNSPCT